MFDDIIKGYKKALVFGTGGGNDIVSAILPALHLDNKGLEVDIAGILSPAAVHTFDGIFEKPVNLINDSVKRYIFTPGYKEISFLDESLPDIIEQENIAINDFYEFSLRYGTFELLRSVDYLIKDKDYDLLVAVDVGGDILARGAQDDTLLSPVMDFSSLYLLGNLDVDSLLIEFGLGTDGELRPQGMDAIIQELIDENLLLSESNISLEDEEIKTFYKINEKIGQVRTGHTATMTFKTLEENQKPDKEDIVSDYRFRSQVGKKRWFTPYEVTLPAKYFGRSYLIDAKGLYQRRKNTAFSYKNPLEQYVRLKSLCPRWKTELDMFCLWSGDSWTTPQCSGKSLFLLVPTTNMPEAQRQEIIDYGSKNLMADMMLILKKDEEYVGSDSFYREDAGDFLLLSHHKDGLSKVAEDVNSYLKVKSE